jgi:hypothetical protein
LFIVISLYRRAIEFTQNPDAGAGICIVTNNITEADEMGATMMARIREHSLERLQIGVDVAENRKSHPFTLRGS